MNRGSSRSKRPPIASLRDRQRETITLALLDAAEAVIHERGLANAGMAEIARRAGVAVGTLYNYFPDREGLVRALLEHRRASFAPRFRALLDTSKGMRFEHRLRQFVRDVLALFDAQRSFVRLAFETEAPLAQNKKTISDALRNCLRDLLFEGVAEGAITDVELPLRVRLLGSAIRSVMLHELEGNGAFVNDADRIVDFFLDGARRR